MFHCFKKLTDKPMKTAGYMIRDFGKSEKEKVSAKSEAKLSLYKRKFDGKEYENFPARHQKETKQSIRKQVIK